MRKQNIFQRNMDLFTLHNPTYQPCAIDTIELAVNPIFVHDKWRNDQQWQPKYSNGKLIKSERVIFIFGQSVKLIIDNSFNNKEHWGTYKIRIQQEFLNPWSNYIIQIQMIIFEIYTRGYIHFETPSNYKNTIVGKQHFILDNLLYIVKLVRLDIYFDFRKEDINQIPSFFQGEICNSTSSPKIGCHRPVWIIYNRKTRIQDCSPKAVWVKEYPFPIRLEIRMDCYNSKNMMNLNYLNGTFFQIFTVFSIHLARSLRKNKHYLYTEVARPNYNGYFNIIENMTYWPKIPNTITADNLWYYTEGEQFYDYNQN